MKFEIKNRWTGNLIFSCEAESWKVAEELAVKSGFDLRDADLRGACLSGADLYGAYLRGACLSDTYLGGAKDDFFNKLICLKDESVYLYKSLVDGKIDGSCYEGECACFCGTLANAKNINHTELPNFGIKVDSTSPVEKLFLAIRKGDTPENNPVSKIVTEWCREFMGKEGIKIPERILTWS